MSFQPIKRILPQVVASHGLSHQVHSRQVVQAATSVLHSLWGPERSAHIEPVSFVEGTLKLQSTSPAALQALRVDNMRLMNEINRSLGARIVLRIEARSKGF